MNRRELLAVSVAGTLLGGGGCIGNLDPRDETGPTTNDVPGCTWKEEWSADITTGPADPDPGSIAGRRDCANAARPEPTGDVCTTFEHERDDGEIIEYHSVGVEPYPEPPDSFDEDSILEYVYEYERAYSQNSAVEDDGERVIAAGFDPMEELARVLDMYDEITVIVIRFGAPVDIRRRDGGFSYDDNFSDAAVYGVDETGLVRTDAEYTNDPDAEKEVADPVEEGILLECF